jgi:hypothetical protein
MPQSPIRVKSRRRFSEQPPASRPYLREHRATECGLNPPAAARILCDGEFQITQYGRIATPYCGDQVIARVANEYGWRYSAAGVGSNPLAKVYICQTLGYDWPLQAPCAGYVPHGGGGPLGLLPAGFSQQCPKVGFPIEIPRRGAREVCALAPSSLQHAERECLSSQCLVHAGKIRCTERSKRSGRLARLSLICVNAVLPN